MGKPMPNKTLYIKTDEDMKIIDRAAKLLAFHEDIGLGTLLTDECRVVIEKYEGKQPGDAK
jgi:hypothetical protein